MGQDSQQVSQSWINGKKFSEKPIPIFFYPFKKGISYQSKPCIEYNRQIYKTSPVKINVTIAVPENARPQ
jgi:hypothetical protein